MAIGKPAAAVPYLTTQQMVEVDRAMIEDYHIELIQMMENAGRNLAHLARELFFDGDPRGRSVVVMAGTGGNGGGAMVAARRLHGYGALVGVFLPRPQEDIAPIPDHQLDALHRMGMLVRPASDLVRIDPVDLVLDGVIGYSLKGAPKDAAAEMIRWANGQDAPILALDAPSGVDATTGTVFDPAIRATVTMTLALPKEGFLKPGAEANVGALYLADISVPPGLYAGPQLGLDVGPIFAEHDIVRLS